MSASTKVKHNWWIARFINESLYVKKRQVTKLIYLE